MLKTHITLALCASLLTACGFERRVEGEWKADPNSVNAKELTKRGVPAALAPTLVSGTFVVEDGMVYLGAKHPDATLLGYRILDEDDDCATVRFHDPAAKDTQTRDARACLRGTDLTVRHDGAKAPLEVTFRRVD